MVIIGTNSDVVTKTCSLRESGPISIRIPFIAASADNRYYCGYTADGSSLMFVIDKSEAASFVKVNQKITAIWADPGQGNSMLPWTVKFTSGKATRGKSFHTSGRARNSSLLHPSIMAQPKSMRTSI